MHGRTQNPIKMDVLHVYKKDGWTPCAKYRNGWSPCMAKQAGWLYNRDGWFHVHNRNGTPTGDSF